MTAVYIKLGDLLSLGCSQCRELVVLKVQCLEETGCSQH